MPLSNTFTDIEVEYVREMCRVANTPSNIDTLVGKLNSLNAAQVNATQRDIEQWKRIEYGTEKAKGGIKGTDYDTERNRQFIRNKVRSRLDYPPLPDALGANDLGVFTMGINWIGGGGSDEHSR